MAIDMSERLKFNPEVWCRNLEKIAEFSFPEKYRELVKLHKDTTAEYIMALSKMKDKAAERAGSGGRLRKIIVAHIMGWEEWQIQVFEDPNKTERLSRQLHLKGYEDPISGKMLDFQSVDEFNAHQEEIYRGWPWRDIRDKAVATAKRLQSFFPESPPTEWLLFLDNGPAKVWRATKDIEITVPGAWYLWMVSLKHEAVEHRKDLLLIQTSSSTP